MEITAINIDDYISKSLRLTDLRKKVKLLEDDYNTQKSNILEYLKKKEIKEINGTRQKVVVGERKTSVITFENARKLLKKLNKLRMLGDIVSVQKKALEKIAGKGDIESVSNVHVNRYASLKIVDLEN